MIICMTNGGMFNDVTSINNRDVNDPKALSLDILTELLETEKYLNVVSNNNQKSLVKTSCISSITY